MDGPTPAPAETTVGAADAAADPFDAPVRAQPAADIDALIVRLEAWEGPLDVLLELARAQRVDLRKISMIALVDQYLEFVAAARAKSLELAADYLVMASWLAFLKSKLLLPQATNAAGEPTADEMAARLAFQLQRLAAMRKAAEALLKRPQALVDVFPRGAPEGVRVVKTPLWQAELYDLLKAYARQRIHSVDRTYTIDPPRVWSLEEARARIERMLGSIPEWTDFIRIAPTRDVDAPPPSVLASAFSATLELAKHGRLEIRQLGAFEPIYVRERRQAVDAAGEGAVVLSSARQSGASP